VTGIVVVRPSSSLRTTTGIPCGVAVTASWTSVQAADRHSPGQQVPHREHRDDADQRDRRQDEDGEPGERDHQRGDRQQEGQDDEQPPDDAGGDRRREAVHGLLGHALIEQDTGLVGHSGLSAAERGATLEVPLLRATGRLP
jgi:hypothetical protein